MSRMRYCLSIKCNQDQNLMMSSPRGLVSFPLCFAVFAVPSNVPTKHSSLVGTSRGMSRWNTIPGISLQPSHHHPDMLFGASCDIPHLKCWDGVGWWPIFFLGKNGMIHPRGFESLASSICICLFTPFPLEPLYPF